MQPNEHHLLRETRKIVVGTISLIIVVASSARGQAGAADRGFHAAPSLPAASVLAPDPVASRVMKSPPTGFVPAKFSLSQMVRAAGIIFSGRVTSIARSVPSRGENLDAIAITFRVENALRDTKPGQNLTIHEWAGLWLSGQRYHVGEEVLLFLYPPSSLGLTSPVAGFMGRFTIDPSGHVILKASQLEAFRTSPELGGKSSMSFAAFAQAVHLASGEE